MATATKKAAKKASDPAKKAATKAPANKPETSEARAAREARDADLTVRIVELRETDPPTKWSDICDELEVSPGKAMFLYEVSQVKPKDRIKWTDDDDLGPQIVEARQEGQSWGTIMARANISEGKARGLYTALTGEDTKGNRIGKGGRFPAGQTPPKAEKPAKKAAKTSTPAKKAAPKLGEIKNINDMNLREITERLTGRKITVGMAGAKSVVIGVKEVMGLEDGELTFLDQKNGGERQIKVSSITKISK